MSANKVAVVTGSNKGIGFAVVKLLSKQFTGDIFLTGKEKFLNCKSIISLRNH